RHCSKASEAHAAPRLHAPRPLTDRRARPFRSSERSRLRADTCDAALEGETGETEAATECRLRTLGTGTHARRSLAFRPERPTHSTRDRGRSRTGHPAMTLSACRGFGTHRR